MNLRMKIDRNDQKNTKRLLVRLGLMVLIFLFILVATAYEVRSDPATPGIATHYLCNTSSFMCVGINVNKSPGVKRKDDRYFAPIERVFWEFEESHGIKVDESDTGAWGGKHLRGELLILLKDEAGLKYREISEIDIFGNARFSSLRRLYRLSKERKKEKDRDEKNRKLLIIFIHNYWQSLT